MKKRPTRRMTPTEVEALLDELALTTVFSRAELVRVLQSFRMIAATNHRGGKGFEVEPALEPATRIAAARGGSGKFALGVALAQILEATERGLAP